jgi:hypothetical protein
MSSSTTTQPTTTPTPTVKKKKRKQKKQKRQKQKRGLGSVRNPEVVKRIALLGGAARAKNKESLARARQLGKKTLLQRYGPSCYSIISQMKGKDGQIIRERYSLEITNDDNDEDDDEEEE